jgi:hypothetical protein
MKPLRAIALTRHDLARSLRKKWMGKQDFGKDRERVFMNEFLLLALIIVYVAISYRRSSTEAQGNQQNRHNEQASHSRGSDDQ